MNSFDHDLMSEETLTWRHFFQNVERGIWHFSAASDSEILPER